MHSHIVSLCPLYEKCESQYSSTSGERGFGSTNFSLELLIDQGTQFIDKLFKEVVKLLAINHVRTTAYHPQCNGVVECINGTLKRAH